MGQHTVSRRATAPIRYKSLGFNMRASQPKKNDRANGIDQTNRPNNKNGRRLSFIHFHSQRAASFGPGDVRDRRRFSTNNRWTATSGSLSQRNGPHTRSLSSRSPENVPAFLLRSFFNSIALLEAVGQTVVFTIFFLFFRMNFNLKLNGFCELPDNRFGKIIAFYEFFSLFSVILSIFADYCLTVGSHLDHRPVSFSVDDKLRRFIWKITEADSVRNPGLF